MIPYMIPNLILQHDTVKQNIKKLNKRVEYEEPCDGRLPSTVSREGRVKFPSFTRSGLTYFDL